MRATVEASPRLILRSPLGFATSLSLFSTGPGTPSGPGQEHPSSFLHRSPLAPLPCPLHGLPYIFYRRTPCSHRRARPSPFGCVLQYLILTLARAQWAPAFGRCLVPFLLSRAEREDQRHSPAPPFFFGLDVLNCTWTSGYSALEAAVETDSVSVIPRAGASQEPDTPQPSAPGTPPEALPSGRHWKAWASGAPSGG